MHAALCRVQTCTRPGATSVPVRYARPGNRKIVKDTAPRRDQPNSSKHPIATAVPGRTSCRGAVTWGAATHASREGSRCPRPSQWMVWARRLTRRHAAGAGGSEPTRHGRRACRGEAEVASRADTSSVWNHFQYSSLVYSEFIRAGRRRIRRLRAGTRRCTTSAAGALRVIV